MRFFRLLLWIGSVLLVPIVPLLYFGDSLDRAIEAYFQPLPGPWTIAGLVVGVLASDLLLPVPSSAVSTLAGAALGFYLGTATCWLGMSVGGVLGFALARAAGRPLAERLATAEDLRSVDQLSRRHGPLVLLLLRPVPLLAEASVLLLGISDLNWRRFLVPLFAANLVVSLAYCGLGQLAGEQRWLPLAVCLAAALPLLATPLVRRWLDLEPTRQGEDS